MQIFCLPLVFVFFRDIDKIDDLMQDITEQQDTAREISEAISRPFGEAFDEVDTFPTSCQNLFIHSFLAIILHSANENALFRIEILSTLRFSRMSCWQNLRNWNRRSLKKTWRVWVGSPVCRAPNYLQHGLVGMEVSVTQQRPEKSGGKLSLNLLLQLCM